MNLEGLFEDVRHGLVALDYFLVYEVQATVHAQLYARGLIQRIKWFVPSASIYEYRPGVVHIQGDDYNEYLRVRTDLLSEPSLGDMRHELVRAMIRSINRLARANWRYEQTPDSDMGPLVEAAVNAMAFYNFNDETSLPEELEHTLEGTGGYNALREVLTPVVTPYMLVLSHRASALLKAPTVHSHRRFVEGVSFLETFDAITARVQTLQQSLASAGRYGCGQQSHSPGDRRRLRRESWDTLSQTVSHWPPSDRQTFMELVLLAATAADHEEARHYWQGRTLRNLRLHMDGMGCDIRTTSIDQLTARTVNREVVPT